MQGTFNSNPPIRIQVRCASDTSCWAGGTSAPNLAMWAALDAAGALAHDTRSKITRSMAQYSLPRPGELDTPAAGRPGRRPPSALLLQRFREGLLDSAIFTAASLGAIWVHIYIYTHI